MKPEREKQQNTTNLIKRGDLQPSNQIVGKANPRGHNVPWFVVITSIRPEEKPRLLPQGKRCHGKNLLPACKIQIPKGIAGAY